MPAKVECYVIGRGTVAQMSPPSRPVEPNFSIQTQLVFFFRGDIGKPRWVRLSLTDQFGKRHGKWVRMRYGGPAEPY